MLNAKQVLEVKGSDVWAVAPDQSVYKAIETMAEKIVGALIVLDGKKLVGIITERHYARNVILRVTPDGDLRGVAALPAGVSSLSGVAAIDADEIYVSSTLGEVFRLGFFPARNTPPTATALTVSFGEKETGRIIALLDGASDANGDPLSVRNVRFPFVHNVDEATGLLTIGDGQFDFVGGGESRNFPIFYDVFDGRDATSTIISSARRRRRAAPCPWCWITLG